jgi:hypothetical protein
MKLSEILRYEPEIFREDRIRMEPDYEGDWVKYSDVLKLLEAQPAAQPTIDLSRLEPFVSGLGKAILREMKEDLAAQPAAQQEPFAYYNPAAKEIVMEAGQRDRYALRTDGKGVGDYARACTEPLYTRPAMLLTEDEIGSAAEAEDNDSAFIAGFHCGVRFAERQHKIGSTP